MRAGQKYGLRVQVADAPKVHAKHKPQSVYLEATQLMGYQGGPFPFGATKGALTTLFREWGWDARPMQPRARVDKGVIWDIQASCKPKYEVYQCEHADILLTEVPRKQKGQRPAPELQASQRTLEALKADSTHATIDPLMVNDPWANSVKTPTKMPRVDTLSPAQLDAIAATVQQKVTASMQPTIKEDTSTDVAMQESRCQDMEARLTSLEQTIQQQEQASQQHRAEVDSRFQVVQTQQEQLKQHVDKQAGLIQQHMDSRMAEQLQHIDRLLNKRLKTQE